MRKGAFEPPSIHRDWIDRGLRHLEGIGTSAQKYQLQTMRKRLLEATATCGWQAVARTARSAGITVDDVGNGLGVHSVTATKWLTGDAIPDAANIFGAITFVLQTAIGNVSFPSHNALLWFVVQNVMARINDEDLEGPRSPPTHLAVR